MSIWILFISIFTLSHYLFAGEFCRIDVEDQIIHQIRVAQFNHEEQFQDHQLDGWMKHLDDGLVVSLLSIPGTHDTGAFRCDYYMPCHIYQCQSLDIYEQLLSGIRYLDLRINSQAPLTIGHQAVKYMLFQEVLKDISKFLGQHSSEFLILAFQRNSGQYDPYEQIKEEFGKFGIQAIYRNSSQIPTVGQLRGKVWVFSGIGINFQPETFVLEGVMGITDTDSIYLQNFWEVSPLSIPVKTTHAMATAFYAPCSKTRIKANFLSGSVFITPFNLVRNRDGPNKRLLKQLSSQNSQCLGITIMDFPDPKLIGSIVESNFKSKKS